jgi:hypothetical protein
VTAAARLLGAYLRKHDLTPADFARRIQHTARRMAGVRAPQYPPYTSVRRWLAGDWVAQVHWRRVVEAATQGYVPEAAWTEEQDAWPE